jgi:hypothetical protein
MSTSVLTASWATYGKGAFWVMNNTWGAGSLVNGVDYTQSISYDSSTFPDGVTMSWDWPMGTSVLAYPEIIYGTQQSIPAPAGVTMPAPTQVADFTNLSAQYSFSISGQTNDFDVGFDLWLNSAPSGGIEDELMVLVHNPWSVPGTTLGTIDNSGIYVSYNWGDSTQNWTFIELAPSADALSGTISFSDILKTLIWDGVITGSEYISGIELGAEVGGGTGSLTINSLSYQWDANPTVTLAAADNTYSVATPGGNNIIGNGAVDTVVYQGAYSQYQIEQSGTETLVQQSGNIATLDVLNGIAFIQFSNGTYDVATSTFMITSAPPAPVITNDIVGTNNTVTLSGTAEADCTVTVYDGQTALGTTTANASGIWSYTTGALTDGTQVLTATATNTAGNTSVASNAVDPSIDEFSGVQAGTLSVANGATIELTGTVDNTGTIALAATGGGADLAVIGSVSLTGTGKVTLSNNAGNAIVSNGASATLTNVSNTISGGGTIGDNYLTLINQGTINANATVALVIDCGNNTDTNSGTLEATSTGGLDIDSSVSNSKTIEADGTNAKVVIASTVTNGTKGLLLASGSGAQVDLDNATISGGTLQTSGSNALIETVNGSANALDGGTISSGSTVEVNGGTILTLNGAIINRGTLLVNGGVLDVAGTLTGGTTEISGAGKATIEQASSESVAFVSNSTGQLVLNQATGYTGEVSGFGTTQSIDLTDLDFAAGVTISYASSNRHNSAGVLTITEGTQTVHLDLEGSYTLANFQVASDGNGGTLLTDPTVDTQAPGGAPATIGNDTVLEVNTPDQGNVTFSGTTGTLWLDQPATFTGKVSGFGAQNSIDLPGIAFNAQTTLGYSPNHNNTGGILSLADGAQSANIALLGSYMASSFVVESDNHGGTMVLADATQSVSQSLLTNPHHG